MLGRERIEPVNKRNRERARKRLMIKYGTVRADRTAFTKNVSAVGIQIKTNSVYRPGTEIQIEIRVPERCFALRGRVVWAKKVPSQLAHVLDCGMGVAFVDPTPEWREFFAEWESGRS
jgi:Tfp pilus assembly protein PilZ